MLGRFLSLVAALVLAVASADAHVGANPWQPETAPPARASIDRTALGEYADATPSRIREKSVPTVKVASGLYNQPYAQVIEDWSATATQAGTTEPTLPTASLQNAYVFGDDLINQVRFNALAANVQPGQPGSIASAGNDAASRIGLGNGESVYHYDGLGSTRFLTAVNLDASGNPVTTGTAQNPANETLTDQYGYAAFGDADVAVTDGTTANNYRYTGEQLDPNLGFYYLRARYMNPGQGRFVGMDEFPGREADPIGQLRYGYADENPISHIDPSGNFSLLDMAVSEDIQSILQNVTREGFRQTARRLIGQARVLGRAILNDVKRCVRQPSKCEIPFNVLVTGMPLVGTAEHIEEAQGANPSVLGRFKGRASTILRRTTPHPRGWMRTTAECRNPLSGILAGKDCDEYPFASTLEGGRTNYYNGSVSLEPVAAWESPLQGVLIGQFYRRCKIPTTSRPVGPWWSDKSAFISLGVPQSPSFFLCKS